MSVRRTIAVLALGLFAVSACSTAPPPGSPTSAAADSSGSGPAADVSNLRTELDKYTGVPTFTAPGGPIDTAALKGKVIFNIPDSSSNPFATTVAEAEQEAADLVGVKYINCTNQGQVTEWVSCYDQAAQQGANIINDFGGADPRQLGPQIQAAQDAGIQVVAHNVYGFSQEPVGIKTSVPTPYELAGNLMAKWVIMDTGRKANVLVITSNEVLATDPIVNGIKESFAAECAGCTMTMVNVPVKDWSTKIQSEVQSAMVRDPGINYVVPIYDSMSQFVVPAITAANKVGQVHVATFNGTPFVLQYLQEGDIVRMVVGESLRWVGWAFLDSDLRLLAGEQLPSVYDEKIPLRIFTKDNVNETGTPPDLTKGYGDEYVAGYKKLWGLQG